MKYSLCVFKYLEKRKMNSLTPKLTKRKIRQRKEQSNISEQIIKYAQANNNLLDKYNISYFINYFEAFKLERLSEIFKEKSQIPIQYFVLILLLNIEHQRKETIFLVMGLSRFYNEIYQNLESNQESIKFTDFTNFIYEKISDVDPDLVISLKDTVNSRINNKEEIKKVSPSIYYHSQEITTKISIDEVKKSKALSSSASITKLYFCEKLKRIIALGRLECCLEIYDTDFNHIKNVYPQEGKEMKKKFPILSFHYSELDRCIGCVVKNVGLVFWDFHDEFMSQKTIKGCDESRIEYSKVLGRWLSIQGKRINVWNIQEQQVMMSIEIDNCEYIIDLCEIDHLQLILVGCALKNDEKWVYLLRVESSSWKIVSKMQLINKTCHHVYYNKQTQTIFILGYRNTVPILLIDHISYDLYPIEQLTGHKSIVTSITGLGGSIIVTGDDKGFIRVWDIRYLRCLQTIKLAKQLTQLACTGDSLLFCDKRLNSIGIYRGKLKYENRKQTKIVQFLVDENLSRLYLFTKTLCQIIDMEDGYLKQIHILCSNQEITVVKKNRNCFYIGTSKGNIIRYGFDFKNKGEYHVHEASISQLIITNDSMFITTSHDTTMKIWVKSPSFQIVSKTLTHLIVDQEIAMLQFSLKFRVFLLSYGDIHLYLCDYETLKTSHIIQFSSNITNVIFISDLPIFMVTCENGEIYCYLITRVQYSLKIDEKSIVKVKGLELENGQFWNELKVYGHFQLMLGSSRGRVAKVDLNILFEKDLFNFIKLAKIDKNCSEESFHNHRPIRQSFRDRQSSSILKVNQKKDVEKVGYLQKIREAKIGDKEILKFDVIEENNIVILREQNLIKILQLQTLQCISEKVIGQFSSKKWKQIQKNKEKVRKTFIQSLQLMKKIQNIQEENQYFQGSMKEKVKEIYNVINNMVQISKYYSSKEVSETEIKPRKWYHRMSDCNPKKSPSIKDLQIYKRVKSIKQQRKQCSKAKRQIQISFKEQKQKEESNEDLRANISFFRPSYRNRFRISASTDFSTNGLYYHIRSRIEKKQKDKENRNVFFPTTKVRKVLSRQVFKKEMEKRKSTSSFASRGPKVENQRLVVNNEHRNSLVERFKKSKIPFRMKSKKVNDICKQLSTRLKKAKKFDKF